MRKEPEESLKSAGCPIFADIRLLHDMISLQNRVHSSLVELIAHPQTCYCVKNMQSKIEVLI